MDLASFHPFSFLALSPSLPFAHSILIFPSRLVGCPYPLSHLPSCLVRISVSRFPRPLTLSSSSFPSSCITVMLLLVPSLLVWSLCCPFPRISSLHLPRTIFVLFFSPRLLMICFHVVFDTYDLSLVCHLAPLIYYDPHPPAIRYWMVHGVLYENSRVI